MVVVHDVAVRPFGLGGREVFQLKQDIYFYLRGMLNPLLV